MLAPRQSLDVSLEREAAFNLQEEHTATGYVWLLEDVQIRESRCGAGVQDKLGALGVQALSTSCSEDADWGSASVQGTLRFEYPLEYLFSVK